MAFGKTLVAEKPKAEATDSGVTQLLNLGNGIRKMRVLPEMKDGELVKIPVLDPTGKPIKGKFTNTPESEVRWLEAWWPVFVDGKQRKQRIMLDINNRWGNPLWKYISANFEKGSEERRAVKERFGINVLNITPAVVDKDGNAVFAGIDGVFNISIRGKKVDVVTGDPKPLNQIQILEGSAGALGGKHLLQQIVDAADGLADNDGNPADLHQATLIIKTSGEGTKTNRSSRVVIDNFKFTPEQLALPRYDIESWIKPWPDDMIERLIDSEDLNALVEEYNIQLYPKLKGDTTVEDTEDELF